MSRLALYGAVVVRPTDDHEPAPAGEAWKTTCDTPEPVSDAAAVRILVARRFAPGSSMDVVGTVLSTRMPVIAGLVKTLPALSVTTMCTW